jgi:2-polyprenyl-3-methyl-5-hydroxy-6-metoxy-1,4-benzoquinol methylase
MIENITCCRLCKSDDLQHIISFGDCALANSYPVSREEMQSVYPLTVVRCGECFHVQLKETIEPTALFENYLYSSSDSPTLLAHFRNYAQSLEQKLTHFIRPKILEIGCNDGILLNALKQIGYSDLIGVDPAKNIVSRASKIEDVVIYNDFFNKAVAEKITNNHGYVDVVCANNVLAHVKQLDSIMEGIAECLSKEGILVFENAYLLDTITGLYFDQVYHEHLQYFSIVPLVRYLNKYGLEIFDIQMVNTQGGSFRIFAQKKHTGKFTVSEAVYAAIEKENSLKLHEMSTYVDFVEKIMKLQKEFNELIKQIKQQGKTISCYGCPAKFALFSKFFNLDDSVVEYVVDDSPLKQGRFSPGSKIQIVSRDYFNAHPTDYCIISVWNMADSIVKNNSQYSGKFIMPMPVVKVMPSNDSF